MGKLLIIRTGGNDDKSEPADNSRSLPIGMNPTPVIQEEEYAQSVTVPPLVEVEGKPASSYRTDVYLRRDLLRRLDPGYLLEDDDNSIIPNLAISRKGEESASYSDGINQIQLERATPPGESGNLTGSI